MKNLIYWLFRHHNYNQILKNLLIKEGFAVDHISSYLSSNGTSKTYTNGLTKKHVDKDQASL